MSFNINEIFKSILQKNEGIRLDDRLSHSVRNMNISDNHTPEVRQMFLKYTDPLYLNFKILINADTDRGLFAGIPEILNNVDPISLYETKHLFDKKMDSALAYLQRIKDPVRFCMLVQWLRLLVDIFKNYDFLIENIEGLNQAYTYKPWQTISDGNIKIVFRETITSKVQELIANYEEILYDKTRGVLILPDNLSRFNISVLVYNAGYYDEDLYGTDESDRDNPHRNILPTIKKFQEIGYTKRDTSKYPYPFIYFMFNFASAKFNWESGSEYFSNVSNSPSNDIIKTQLSLDYYSVGYNNCFHGMFGNIDFPTAIVMLSALNGIENTLRLQSEMTALSMDGRYKLTDYADYILNGSIRNNKWGKQFLDSWKTVGPALRANGEKLTEKYTRSLKNWVDNVSTSIVKLTDPGLLANLTTKSLVKLMNSMDAQVYEKLKIRDINTFMNINLSDRALSYWTKAENNIINNINQAIFGSSNNPDIVNQSLFETDVKNRDREGNITNIELFDTAPNINNWPKLMKDNMLEPCDQNKAKLMSSALTMEETIQMTTYNRKSF